MTDEVLEVIDELSKEELEAILNNAEVTFEERADRIELCDLVETLYSTGAIEAEDILNLELNPFRR